MNLFFSKVLLIPSLSIFHTSTLVSTCLNNWKFSRIFPLLALLQAFVYVFSSMYWNNLFGKKLIYLFTETQKIPPPLPKRKILHSFVFLILFFINSTGHCQLFTLSITQLFTANVWIFLWFGSITSCFQIFFKSPDVAIQSLYECPFWELWWNKQFLICSCYYPLLILQEYMSSITLQCGWEELYWPTHTNANSRLNLWKVSAK